MIINPRDPFLASWTMSNAPLHPSNPQGIRQKIIEKVGYFARYIPNLMIAACVNPRNGSEFYPHSHLTTTHESFRKKIITPDHVHLTADVRVVKNATCMTPTVILFNPLGTNTSIHNVIKKELIDRGCNAVGFDYRGRENTEKGSDLVTDGESIFQYVTKELGTQSDQVHFYGFSLGGAIAAEVKALHAESGGKYVGDRTFRSVFSLITENCCITRLGRLIKKMTSFISAIFLAYPLYLLGWEWEAGKSLARLKGDKRVIIHPNDVLIPAEASLAFQCPSEQVICLDPKEKGFSTHFTPIEAHQTNDGLCAVTVVADFLADTNQIPLS